MKKINEKRKIKYKKIAKTKERVPWEEDLKVWQTFPLERRFVGVSVERRVRESEKTSLKN